MNFKPVAISTFVIAIVAGYALYERFADPTNAEITNQAEPRVPDIAVDSGAAPILDIANNSNSIADNPEQVAVSNNTDVIGNDIDGPKWPEGIENLILDYFSQLEGFKFVSINSVNCEPQTCEIVFSGTSPNPQFVDGYSDVMSGLYRQPINARQGSIGTREIAAGAREFVIAISSIPYVEPSREQ